MRGRRSASYGAWGLYLFCAGVFLFLIAPSLVVIPMGFSSASFLKFPPPGFSLQWFREYFGDERWLAATWRSLRIAASAMVAATVVGTMAALALTRRRGVMKTILNVVIISPMILPVIVYALAIYSVYAWLQLVGTDLGLIISHTILAIPFVFLTVTATLYRYDISLSRAAASSGANAWQTFWRIMLPLIRPGIIAGALFAFITSFDEIVVALFISGVQSTLPKMMFDELRFELKPVLAAIATLLIGVTTVILLMAARFQRSLQDQFASAESDVSAGARV